MKKITFYSVLAILLCGNACATMVPYNGNAQQETPNGRIDSSFPGIVGTSPLGGGFGQSLTSASVRIVNNPLQKLASSVNKIGANMQQALKSGQNVAQVFAAPNGDFVAVMAGNLNNLPSQPQSSQFTVPPMQPFQQPSQFTMPQVQPFPQPPQFTVPPMQPFQQPPQFTVPPMQPFQQPPQFTVPPMQPFQQPPQFTVPPMQPFQQPPQFTVPPMQPFQQPPQCTLPPAQTFNWTPFSNASCSPLDRLYQALKLNRSRAIIEGKEVDTITATPNDLTINLNEVWDIYNTNLRNFIPDLSNEIDISELQIYNFSQRRNYSVSCPIDELFVLIKAPNLLWYSEQLAYPQEAYNFCARGKPANVHRLGYAILFCYMRQNLIFGEFNPTVQVKGIVALQSQRISPDVVKQILQHLCMLRKKNM